MALPRPAAHTFQHVSTQGSASRPRIRHNPSKSHFETSLNLFDLSLSEVLQRKKAQSVQQMI